MRIAACPSIPGERIPDAEMRPGAKGQMIVSQSPQIQAIGIFELSRIAIGRRQKKKNGFPSLNPDTGNFEFLLGNSGNELNRTFVPKQFLNSRANNFGILSD